MVKILPVEAVPERLHDFQGDHELIAGVDAFAHAVCVTQRQGHIEPRKHCEREIDLCSNTAYFLSHNGRVEIGGEAGDENGRSCPRQEESGPTDTPEPYWRQIQLNHRTNEIAAENFVQLESRQSVFIAIALDLSAVDVVVAESTEEEIRELVERFAECDAS